MKLYVDGNGVVYQKGLLNTFAVVAGRQVGTIVVKR